MADPHTPAPRPDPSPDPEPLTRPEPTHLRRSPAHGMTAEMDAASVAGPAGVQLREIAFAPQLGIRAAPGSASASRIERALGVSLPSGVGETTGDPDALHCVWISPDEFLTIDVSRTHVHGGHVKGEHVPGGHMHGGLVHGEAGAVAAVLEDDRPGAGRLPGQVVDLSGNRAILELTGPSARAVLEKGCHVDLHPRAFPVGHAVSTLVGPVPMIVHRAQEETFRLLPRSSFAQYTVRWLTDAMLEFRTISA